MDMDKKMEKSLLSQGDRTSRDLALQGTVPAAVSSGEQRAPESNYGPSGVLPTRAPEELTIVVDDVVGDSPSSEAELLRRGITSDRSEPEPSMVKLKAPRTRTSERASPFVTPYTKRWTGPMSHKSRLTRSMDRLSGSTEGLHLRKVSPASSVQSDGRMDCESGDENPGKASHNSEAETDCEEDETRDDDERSATSNPDKPRGRSRPPITGLYVKRAETKQKLINKEREELDFRLEQMSADKILEGRRILASRGPGSTDTPTADLTASINTSIDGIKEVAKISKGLKGTSIKILNIAAATISSAVEELEARMYENKGGKKSETVSSAVWEAKLKAAEKRIEELKKEVDNLKSRQTAQKTEAPKEKRQIRHKRKAEWGVDLSDDEDKVWQRIRNTEEKEEKEQDRDKTLTKNIVDSVKEILKSEIKTLREEIDYKYLPRESIPSGNLPVLQPLGHGYSPVEETPGGSYMETEEYPSLLPRLEEASTSRHEPEKREKRDVNTTEKKEKGKAKPRIISNIKIKEPLRKTIKERDEPKFTRIGKNLQSLHEEVIEENKLVGKEEKWTDVVKRRIEKKPSERLNKPNVGSKTEKEVPRKQGAKIQQKKKARKLPKTEAITIVCPAGNYEEVMLEATSKIDLEALGIPNGVQQRMTRTGALSIQIAGEGNKEKADLLSDCLKQTLVDKEGVKISRPIIKSEILITRLDHIAKAATIAASIAKAGECQIEDVNVNPVVINPNTRRGTAWARCPAKAANKIVAEGGLQVGWAKVGAIHMERRPLQCFRCFASGHVRAECTSSIDRSSWCYRCGGVDHLAKTCKEPPKCPLCTEKGRRSNHRVGGKGCNPTNKKDSQAKKGMENKEAKKTTKGERKPTSKGGTQTSQAVDSNNIYNNLTRNDNMGTDVPTSVNRDTQEDSKTALSEVSGNTLLTPMVVDLEEEEEQMEFERTKTVRPAPPSSPGECSSPVVKRSKATRKVISSEEEEEDAQEEAYKHKRKDDE